MSKRSTSRGFSLPAQQAHRQALQVLDDHLARLARRHADERLGGPHVLGLVSVDDVVNAQDLVAPVLRQTAHDKLMMLGEHQTVIGTVLFGDVRGSTALADYIAEQGGLPLVSRFYQALYEAFARSIESADVVVEKFIGDGALMFWSGRSKNSILSALKAARQIRHAVDGLWLDLSKGKKNIPRTAAGIGIAYGPVVRGHFGLQGIHELTIVGPTVNRAAKLCQTAQPGEILICGASRGLVCDMTGSPWTSHDFERINRRVEGCGEPWRVLQLQPKRSVQRRNRKPIDGVQAEE